MNLGARSSDFKERVGHWWADFRSHSIYFQLKAMVLICYLTIVGGTIVIAPPSSIAENEIGARIIPLPGDIVMGPYFIIENGSRAHWQQVTMEIDQGYRVVRDLVSAGERVTLYVTDFKKRVLRRRRGREIPKTVSAPADMPVSKLSIKCREGMAIEPLAFGERSGTAL
jgi:hypothetical protein